MLGTDTMVTDKQFQSKCFEMFRNNCNKETVVCYNQSDIENIINKYLSPTVYMDNLNDLYIEIKADYDSVSNIIEKLANGPVNMLDLQAALGNNAYGSAKFGDNTVPEDFNDVLT